MTDFATHIAANAQAIIDRAEGGLALWLNNKPADTTYTVAPDRGTAFEAAGLIDIEANLVAEAGGVQWTQRLVLSGYEQKDRWYIQTILLLADC